MTCCSYLQAKAGAKPGAQSLLPRVRSSSSTPSQDPRPLIAGATAHITGPRAKTAADILVEEGKAHLLVCKSEDGNSYVPSCTLQGRRLMCKSASPR